MCVYGQRIYRSGCSRRAAGCRRPPKPAYGLPSPSKGMALTLLRHGSEQQTATVIAPNLLQAQLRR